MNDKLLELLVQKITITMEDIAELNMLVRRMDKSGEALSRMNERVDATQTAVREIEKIMQGEVKAVEVVNAAIGELKTDIKTVQENMAEVQTGIVQLPELVSIPHEKFDGLRQAMENLRLQLRTPLEQQVRHHHHLAKSSLLNIVFFGIIVLLGFFLISAWKDDDVERSNAFKYRWLRISMTSDQIKSLQYIDSMYLVDPAGFRDSTVEGERRQKEAYENWLNLTREKEDVKEREERAKSRPRQR